ncbi:hypothetical protein McpSp1_13930 [Methanocorpusculaceae archaeon Sp1]|nr:hypothetical protein [Methanocorpusculaceae archaeon Sp1]
MVIGIVENLYSSYDFTNKALKSFSDWLILIFINLMAVAGALLIFCGVFGMIISALSAYNLPTMTSNSMVLGDPISSSMTSAFAMAGIFSMVFIGLGIILALIFGILLTGVQIRAYRGGELTLGSYGGMFLDGLLATIISFIYFIPYIIISILLNFGPMMNPAYVIASMIIEIVVMIVTMLFYLMAVIRFAKVQKFSAAFELKEILNVISTIGWLTYIVNIIVVGIVILVIYLILALIPVVGWGLLIVVMPFLIIWEARFFGALYESATATKEIEPASP